MTKRTMTRILEHGVTLQNVLFCKLIIKQQLTINHRYSFSYFMNAFYAIFWQLSYLLLRIIKAGLTFKNKKINHNHIRNYAKTNLNYTFGSKSADVFNFLTCSSFKCSHCVIFTGNEYIIWILLFN